MARSADCMIRLMSEARQEVCVFVHLRDLMCTALLHSVCVRVCVCAAGCEMESGCKWM